jgi:hypothetical protein
MFLMPMREATLSFAKREGALFMMRENSSRLRMPNEHEYQAFRASPIVAFHQARRMTTFGMTVKTVIVVIALTSIVLTAGFYMLMSRFH